MPVPEKYFGISNNENSSDERRREPCAPGLLSITYNLRFSTYQGAGYFCLFICN